jgi:hypothetical protein
MHQRSSNSTSSNTTHVHVNARIYIHTHLGYGFGKATTARLYQSLFISTLGYINYQNIDADDAPIFLSPIYLRLDIPMTKAPTYVLIFLQKINRRNE